MAKPNVHTRIRKVGWVDGYVMGNGGNITHGARGNLTPGFPQDSFPIQVNAAILGANSVLYRDEIANPQLYQSRSIGRVRDTHCVYLEVAAHLRSLGGASLPGIIRVWVNELPPLPPGDNTQLGDWVLNGWQEWEDYSPISVPTIPASFPSLGGLGDRYEYRRVLGRIPGNIIFVEIENVGTVAATDWGLHVYLRSDPPVIR